MAEPWAKSSAIQLDCVPLHLLVRGATESSSQRLVPEQRLHLLYLMERILVEALDIARESKLMDNSLAHSNYR